MVVHVYIVEKIMVLDAFISSGNVLVSRVTRIQ